ncbi:hypothetical protein ABW21_db0201844 [Orbilia brochopaga]|nr:hypothetical protein ABW21_db0201844 [Drechslerella brochopaga]
MAAYFGSPDEPLWHFVGLIFMFSILIGSPIFVCFVYHRRREQEHLQTEVRKATFAVAGSADTTSGLTLRSRYQVPGRDHYVLPFPPEVNVPPTPRRSASGGSTVPLLTLSPEAGPSRNVSGSYSYTHTMATDAVDNARRHDTSREVSGSGTSGLGVDFAERAGAATALAYPETVHRGLQRQRMDGINGAGGYGTLGHVMHSTYTAAQRAYRARHRLNFWAAWMAPWLRTPSRLAAIDEESVGTSRHGKSRRDRNANTDAQKTAAATQPRDIKPNRQGHMVRGSNGSTGTLTSGYSMGTSFDTPPAFTKIDVNAGYNPSMARSLTRRLLKVGFEAKDGVDADAGEVKKSKSVSNVWKGRAELKKRAMERRKAQGSGQRFSLPRRRFAGSEESIVEEDISVIGELALSETSIRDFAHAFNKDIVGESATGTVRHHEIDDPIDYSDDEQDGTTADKENTDTPSTIIAGPPAATMDTTTEISQSLVNMSPSTRLHDENKPTRSAGATLMTNIRDGDTVDDSTLRGRRTRRAISMPGTQKLRMTRNTPKNTGSRVALADSMVMGIRKTTAVVTMESEVD